MHSTLKPSIRRAAFIAVPLVFILIGTACRPPAQAQGPGANGEYSVQVISRTAETRDITESIRLVGSMSPNESINVTSEIAGIADEVAFDEGQEVNRGDLLVKLNTDKLEAQIGQIEAEYQLAKQNYERGQTLVKDNVISVEEFDQRESRYRNAEAMLNLRQEQLQDAYIRAPFDGILGEREISPGQYVTPGQRITRLVDVTPLKAEFRVPERYISQIANGQEVNITVTSYPDETFTGTVYFISPEVDQNTRTLLVKAKVANESKRLKPGMFGNLELKLNVKKNAIVVPESSIFFMGDQKFVYLFSENGTADLRPVATGKRLPGEVEVQSGVQPGERVIAEGHPQKLYPGVKVIEADTESFTTPTMDAVNDQTFEG